MSPQWKPENYTNALPYLIAGDAGRAFRFFIEAFDGEERRRYEDPPRNVWWMATQERSDRSAES